jgi:peptidoglycan/LPS O-acetylase OafA/YrhL
MSMTMAAAIVVATFTKGKEIAYWAAYIFPPTRLPEFVLGICAYRLHLSSNLRPTYRQATTLEAAAVITAVTSMRLCRMASEYIVASHASQSGFSDWLMSGAGGLPFALLIFAFSDQRGALSKALCNKFWVLLGEASFALYMVHQIIFRMMWDRYTLVTSFPNGMMWSLYAALSLTLAFGLHFLFEKPARKAIMSWFDSRKGVQPRIGTGA